MKNQPETLARRFAKCLVGDVAISAVTYAELEYGVAVSADPERERTNLAAPIEDIPVAPFDRPAAAACGPIRLATRDSRKDHLDKLIAAHAVALDVTLVANNLKDFAKHPGLTAENWVDVPAPG